MTPASPTPTDPVVPIPSVHAFLSSRLLVMRVWLSLRRIVFGRVRLWRDSFNSACAVSSGMLLVLPRYYSVMHPRAYAPVGAGNLSAPFLVAQSPAHVSVHSVIMGMAWWKNQRV